MKAFFLINHIPPDHGGGYLRAYRMASRFLENGHLFRIGTLTRRNENSDYGNMLKNIVFFNWNLMFVPFQIAYSLFRNREGYDTLYVVSPRWYTALGVWIASKLQKKVIVGITLQNVDSPYGEDSSLKDVILRFLKKSQFDHATKIIVNSKAVYDDCVSFGYSESKVVLLVNPVDIHRFCAPNDYEEIALLRAKHLLPGDKKIILFVGVIDLRKGVDLLEEIIKRVDGQPNDLFLVICTNSETASSRFGTKFLADLAESGINHKVFQDVKEIEEFYKLCDLFVFPTLNEGLPNVVIEAMASGCLILSNQLDGITDFLLPKEMLIQSNKLEQYAAMANDMLTSPIKYRPLLEMNRRKIETEFASQKVDSEFLAL